MLLELIDVLVAILPQSISALGSCQLLTLDPLRMHPHHQHFFIVGAVENADTPARRQASAIAPKEIVLQIFRGWLLKTEDLTALRVYAAHNVLNHAIFSGGVHGLQHHQQSVFVASPK